MNQMTFAQLAQDLLIELEDEDFWMSRIEDYQEKLNEAWKADSGLPNVTGSIFRIQRKGSGASRSVKLTLFNPNTNVHLTRSYVCAINLGGYWSVIRDERSAYNLACNSLKRLLKFAEKMSPLTCEEYKGEETAKNENIRSLAVDTPKKKKKNTIDQRMRAEAKLQPEIKSNTKEQWMKLLDCTSGGITNAKFWKECAPYRELRDAEKDFRTDN